MSGTLKESNPWAPDLDVAVDVENGATVDVRAAAFIDSADPIIDISQQPVSGSATPVGDGEIELTLSQEGEGQALYTLTDTGGFVSAPAILRLTGVSQPDPDPDPPSPPPGGNETWSPEMIYTYGMGGKDDFSRWPIGTGITYTKTIRGVNIGPRMTARGNANTALNGYNGNYFAIGPVRGSTALGHPTRTWTKRQAGGAGPPSATFPCPNDWPRFLRNGQPGGEVANAIMDDGRIQNVYHPWRDENGGDRSYRLLHNGLFASGRLHTVARGVRVGTSAGGGNPCFGGLMRHELDTPGFFIAHAHHWAPNGRGPLAEQVLAKGFQYPCGSTDGFAREPQNCNGPIPYGVLLAIRPQDLQGIVNQIKAVSGVTSGAKEAVIRFAIAHCLYGVIPIDQGAGYRGDLVTTIPGRARDFRAIMQAINWFSHFYYCQGAVTGADAQILESGALTGSIGTPTGSATVPHGGGSPISVIVDGVTYTGYNGAWDA